MVRTISANKEKGLLFNIFAFGQIMIYFFVLYIVQKIDQPQTLVNLSLITGYFFRL